MKKLLLFLALIIFIFIAWYCLSSQSTHQYPYGTTEEDVRNGDTW